MWLFSVINAGKNTILFPFLKSVFVFLVGIFILACYFYESFFKEKSM